MDEQLFTDFDAAYLAAQDARERGLGVVIYQPTPGGPVSVYTLPVYDPSSGHMDDFVPLAVAAQRLGISLSRAAGRSRLAPWERDYLPTAVNPNAPGRQGRRVVPAEVLSQDSAIPA